MSDPTGGPAFPGGPHHYAAGMNLRDYFAAKAMAVILPKLIGASGPYEKTAAAAAYMMADFMLKERDK
jgi:single-stranded DNA-specific DHH superfamily exonuclease